MARTRFQLLALLVFIAGILSAFFVNDTICLIFAPLFHGQYKLTAGSELDARPLHRCLDQNRRSRKADGSTDQVGWRNMRALRMGADFSPHCNIKANFDYYFFWLASRYDGLYNAGGALE